MITYKKIYTITLIIFLLMFTFMTKVTAKYEKLFHDFSIESITGEIINLSSYKNKVILMVNVASNCGFTNQYSDLQKLWEKYRERGLIIIGFPSNQFGEQEPGTDSDIKEFCETNFNINFPLTTKIDVKGKNINSIYQWAEKNYGKSAIPKWNFYKILIDKDGKIFKTYSSLTKPMSNKLIKDIENILENT